MKIHLFILLLFAVAAMIALPLFASETMGTPEESMIAVRRYFEKNEYDEAIPILNQIITEKPDFVEARVIRGTIFYRTQRYKMALADLDKAIALNPKLAEAYESKGMTFLALANPEKALPAFNQALTLTNYKSPIALYGRGMANSMIGKYEDGVLDLVTANELGFAVDPEVVQAINQKALKQKMTVYSEVKAKSELKVNPAPVKASVSRPAVVTIKPIVPALAKKAA